MRLLVHLGTGTILDARECVIVNVDDELAGDDQTIVELAECTGTPVAE